MEFFGIEMKGPLFLEKFVNLPKFNVEVDSGRLIYIESSQSLYYGGTTSWLGLGIALSATLSEVNLGLLSNKYVSPKTLRDIKATITEADEGVDDIKYVTPAGLKYRMNNNPGVIPGTIIYYAGIGVPSGYLECDGSLVSRITYENLFNAISTTYGSGDGSTTFNLPDLRGEFIRGWDNGRGVDVGRALFSTQASSNKSHTHTGSTSTIGDHTHSATTNFCCTSSVNQSYRLSGDDSAWSNIVNGNTPGINPAGSHTHSLTTNASGETESRPRNVALLPCIKF